MANDTTDMGDPRRADCHDSGLYLAHVRMREEEQMRNSLQPTYDSRVTGPAYSVTYRVNGKTLTFRELVPDPFIRGRVTVGWWDILRGLVRGSLTVEMIVEASQYRMDDVLELDANTLLHNSSRRRDFDAQIQGAMEKL